MQTYYDEEGNVLGKAWSVFLGPCNNTENHKPHPYNPRFAMYGPYFCEGLPAVKLFETPPRKAVN